jgi:hypothetical protein
MPAYSMKGKDARYIYFPSAYYDKVKYTDIP